MAENKSKPIEKERQLIYRKKQLICILAYLVHTLFVNTRFISMYDRPIVYQNVFTFDKTKGKRRCSFRVSANGKREWARQ